MSIRRLQALFERQIELERAQDDVTAKHLLLMSMGKENVHPNILWNLTALEESVRAELDAVQKKMSDAQNVRYDCTRLYH